MSGDQLSQNKRVSKEDIIQGVRILDLADEFQIGLEKLNSGNFDYRCKCPSKNHKNGNERTNSCCINSKKNDFHCYGCLAHGNAIDFYMLCTETTFSEAFSILKERVEPGSQVDYYCEEPNNFYIILEISKLFHKTILEHPEDLFWIQKLIQYSDQFILELESNQDMKAKSLLKNIEKTIQKRYGA